MEHSRIPAIRVTNDFEWGPGDGLTTFAIENRPALEEAHRRALEKQAITGIQGDLHKKIDRETPQD